MSSGTRSLAGSEPMEPDQLAPTQLLALSAICGFVILLVGLTILLVLAWPDPFVGSNPTAAEAQMHLIGQGAREEIRDAAFNFQTQAKEIIERGKPDV